jgi:hypothetical protein
MRIDSQLSFIPVGGNLSLVGGAGIGFPSTNIIDILGTGVGTAPQNIIGNATLFGSDVGVGGKRPEVEVVVGTVFTTSNAATLNVQFQAAQDQGVGGGYQPSTWNTLVETGAIAVANLTAGQILARFPFVPAFPANLQPRFLRLNFVIPAGTNFTTGTISNAIVTLVRDDQSNRYAQRNYTVA